MNCNWPDVVCACVILFSFFCQRGVQDPGDGQGKDEGYQAGLSHRSPEYGRRRWPACGRDCVLTLHERHGLSHRKLADLFNQLYLAGDGRARGAHLGARVAGSGKRMRRCTASVS